MHPDCLGRNDYDCRPTLRPTWVHLLVDLHQIVDEERRETRRDTGTEAGRRTAQQNDTTTSYSTDRTKRDAAEPERQAGRQCGNQQ